MTIGVYAITNLKTGRRYIGSSARVEERWAHHRYELKRQRHENPHLQSSWNCYGADAFEFVLLETVADRSLLTQREQFHLDLEPNPYNLLTVVTALPDRRGYRMSAETKAKIGAAHRGKHITEATRAKIREARAKQVTTLETRMKISASHRGRRKSAATRQRMVEAQARRPAPSAESRARMRAAALRRLENPLERAQLAANAARGRKNRWKREQAA